MVEREFLAQVERADERASAEDCELDDTPESDASAADQESGRCVEKLSPTTAGSATAATALSAKETLATSAQSPQSRHTGYLYRCVTRSRCLWSCLQRYPRLVAMSYGVVLPLGLLVIISTVFGLILARSEAPNEVRVNDEKLANVAFRVVATSTLGRMAKYIPQVCVELYIQNDTSFANLTQNLVIEVFDFLLNNGTSGGDAGGSDSTGQIVAVNTTELSNFMAECGQAAVPILENITAGLEKAVNGSGKTTFNWIRCFPGARGIQELTIPWLNKSSLPVIQPKAQREFYKQTWWNDQQRLYHHYLNQTFNNSGHLDLPSPYNATRAVLAAFSLSIREATGGSQCDLNGAASGWFWFTILSTVGYGNQEITTYKGRRFVIVFGFLSILAFGGILVSAGHVLASIVDDALARLNLRFFTRHWASSLLWGGLYYLFMVFIALFTVHWKHDRLDLQSFNMADGFWFTYISSTTVGLGDIFLEPEVFLGIDLVSFPILFLISFVLASACLNKLGQWFASALGRGSLLDELLAELETIKPY